MLAGSLIISLHSNGFGGYNRLFRVDATNRAMTPMRGAGLTRGGSSRGPEGDRQQPGGVGQKQGQQALQDREDGGIPAKARLAIRRKQSLPILNKIHPELLGAKSRAHGALRKAVNHKLNAFDALRRFIFDGRPKIDNNAIKRCIRLIALAQKNLIGASLHQAAPV